MLSATWPLGVRRLAQTYMNNPIQVYVGSLDLAATHTVTQTIELIDENDKESKVCYRDLYVVKAAKYVLGRKPVMQYIHTPNSSPTPSTFVLL